jgi:predicted nucleic acid-binding protein
MSPSTCFIDSNIILYALLNFQDKEKHEISKEIIKSSSPYISTQVINEVTNNLLRLSQASEEYIREVIKSFFLDYTVIFPTQETLLSASAIRSKYKFSYWDSMIVACALEAQSDILYSEDMQHTMRIEDSLTIINPFL